MKTVYDTPIMAAKITEGRLEALQADMVEELRLLETKFRMTPDDRRRRQHLRETLVQIDHGLHPNDGTDARLDALLRAPLPASLGLACPGLQSVRRLIATLEQRRDEAAKKAAIVWPRRYRYIGKPRKTAWGERYLQPGEVVELTESRAAAWADRFELVADEHANA